MWKILSNDNLNQAIKQVRKNKGKPGVDGMTVDEVKMYFVKHESTYSSSVCRRMMHTKTAIPASRLPE